MCIFTFVVYYIYLHIYYIMHIYIFSMIIYIYIYVCVCVYIDIKLRIGKMFFLQPPASEGFVCLVSRLLSWWTFETHRAVVNTQQVLPFGMRTFVRVHVTKTYTTNHREIFCTQVLGNVLVRLSLYRSFSPASASLAYSLCTGLKSLTPVCKDILGTVLIIQ